MNPDHFHQLSEAIRDPLLLVTSSGTIVAMNSPAETLLGIREDAAAGMTLADYSADPPEKIQAFLAVSSRSRQPLPGALNIGNLKLRAEGGVVRPAAAHAPALVLLRLLNGKDASSRFVALNEKIAELIVQIRERQETERLISAQNRLLELVLRDEPLPQILDALVLLSEAESAEGMLASILLTDASGKRLRHGAAPNLPADYSRAIDGVEIGPSAGSCGTAAFTGNPVIVADIASDPLWKDYRELALSFGLRACWSTPIKSSSGHILGTFAMYYRDVRSPSPRDRKLIALVTRTASVAIERALAQDEIRFHALLLDTVEEAVIATDLEGWIRYWNRFAERLYGWSREEALGKNVSDLLPVDAESAATIMKKPLSGESWSGEFLLRHRNGTVFPAQVTDSPIHDDSGRIIGVVGISYDITRRKRDEEERSRLLESEQAAREAAERASRLKDEFLATVSHELRTPLTAVLGWSRILLSDPAIQGESRQAIETIERSSRQQAQLIEELLDVSRIITGKLRLEAQPVDLERIVEHVIDIVRQTAEAKQIRINRMLQSGPGMVMGDPERLQQILWNLLSNAIKFSPRGSRVEVVLRSSESSAEIIVADEGEGIAQDFLPYIFDRFSQADGSTSRAHGGLGLGLSIARHLVELHGGSIHAASPGTGKGAAFTVRLPFIALDLQPAARQSQAASESMGSPRMEGLRLLIAEDDAPSRQMLTSLFTRFGAEVTATRSTQEAMEAFETTNPHILISDIAMPGSDGYELIRRVRQAERELGRPLVPAIALTAHARAEDRMRALRAGFQMHVPKPVDPEELITVVSSLARLDIT